MCFYRSNFFFLKSILLLKAIGKLLTSSSLEKMAEKAWGIPMALSKSAFSPAHTQADIADSFSGQTVRGQDGLQHDYLYKSAKYCA